MAHTLSDARFLIQEFIQSAKSKNNKNGHLTELKNADSLVEDMIVIENSVRDCFATGIDINADVDTILDQYKKNISSARKKCKEMVEALRAKIRKLQDPNNSPEFANLLENIIPHLEAVITEAESIEINIDTELYKVCRALGGLFYPISQGDDPLMGKVKSELGWTENRGQCDGLVKQSADEISKTGIANHYPVVHENTRHYQDTQALKIPHHIINTKEYSLSGDKKEAISTFIHHVMKKLTPEYVYKIGLKGEGGHSTRIRKIPGTDIIEFYEPNWGTFYFNNEEKFCAFYILMMNRYRGRDSEYLFYFLIKLVTQPQDVKDTNTPLKFQTLKINEDEIIAYVKQAMHEAHLFVDKNYYTEEKALVLVHDLITAVLPYISDRKKLEKVITESDVIPMSNEKEFLNLISADENKSKEETKQIPSDLKEIKKNKNEKNSSAMLKFNSPLIARAHIIRKDKIKSEKSFFDVVAEAKHNLMDLQETFKITPMKLTVTTQNQINLIQTNIKNIVNLLESKNFDINTLKLSLSYLHSVLEKISHEISQEQSQAVCNNFATCIRVSLQQIRDLMTQFNPYEKFYNPRLDKMENKQRIASDKAELQKIINKMKESPRFSEKFVAINSGLKHLISVDIFPNLTIPQKLQAICDKDYGSFVELENDVHEVNKSAAGYSGLSECATYLDNFFKEYLGFTNYSRDFKCFKFVDEPESPQHN